MINYAYIPPRQFQIAQDFSDGYEAESRSRSRPQGQAEASMPSIPSSVFMQLGTDSNGRDRQLIDWYRELESSRSQDEDANGALGALANALQVSPYELQKRLECAEEITQAVQMNTLELMEAAKGLRLSNWATAYQSFLKEAQTCYLHYQLTNEGNGSEGGGGGVVPTHVFEEWVVDVYAVNQVSVNSHGDDATKSSNSIGLLHWYTELEFARMQAESDSTSAESDETEERELSRMEELEKIAAMGAEHEQLLHTLITRWSKSKGRGRQGREVLVLEVRTEFASLFLSLSRGFSMVSALISFSMFFVSTLSLSLFIQHPPTPPPPPPLHLICADMTPPPKSSLPISANATCCARWPAAA